MDTLQSCTYSLFDQIFGLEASIYNRNTFLIKRVNKMWIMLMKIIVGLATQVYLTVCHIPTCLGCGYDRAWRSAFSVRKAKINLKQNVRMFTLSTRTSAENLAPGIIGTIFQPMGIFQRVPKWAAGLIQSPWDVSTQASPTLRFQWANKTNKY